MPNRETAQRRMFEEGRRDLEDAVALLPTPRTSDAQGPGKHGSGGVDLRTAITLLPTPTTSDAKASRNTTANRSPGSKHHDGSTLTDAVSLLGATTPPPSDDGKPPTAPPPDPETTEAG
jgi:hypothetical protein